MRTEPRIILVRGELPRTGVKRQSIMRFMAGTQSLRLDIGDKLARYVELELRPLRRG